MLTTLDHQESTFNSSSRVLPLSMIYNEDFSLQKTNASTNVSNSMAMQKRVTAISKNNDNSRTNNNSQMCDRTRATFKESSTD